MFRCVTLYGWYVLIYFDSKPDLIFTIPINYNTITDFPDFVNSILINQCNYHYCYDFILHNITNEKVILNK